LLPIPELQRGQHRAARSGLGAWVGARVASPRRHILRPGGASVSWRLGPAKGLLPGLGLPPRLGDRVVLPPGSVAGPTGCAAGGNAGDGPVRMERPGELPGGPWAAEQAVRSRPSRTLGCGQDWLIALRKQLRMCMIQ
jgi:hypothetical protein